MGLWDIIGLVKGLLFADTRTLLEPMLTLCDQLTDLLGAISFSVNESLLLLAFILLFYFFLYLYPPNNEVVMGYIGFTPSFCPSVCPSARPSIRLSCLPCPLCNIYSSGWMLSILATNGHYHERVCRTQWPLTLTYIFKVIWIDLENNVRSVASPVLDGFFLYLAQMITIIRGCVVCYVFFRIWKFGLDLEK